MKNFKIWFYFSIIIWILTLGSWVFYFISGSTVKSTDSRTEIVLNTKQRDLILYEMRTLLESVNHIIDGVAEEDYAKVQANAKRAGMQLSEEINPVFMNKLPLSFKQLGVKVHKNFDNLAESIGEKPDPKMVLKKIGAITSSCVACHSTYKLTVKDWGTH